MKRIRKLFCIMLSVMVLLTALPMLSNAESAGVLVDDSNFILGNDYEVNIGVGEKVWLFEATESVELTGMSSIYSDAVSVRDLGEGNIEIKGVEGGTAAVTVTGYDSIKKEYLSTVITVRVTEVETYDWVCKNTKKVRVDVSNSQVGDVIKLKIGKKTYTHKIKSQTEKYSVKIKIKKPGFYGKKYTLTLKRKGKTITKVKEYVYLGKKVHIGDSKKKVKWLADWNDPDKKNKSAYSEQWCYDWDGDGYHDAYLYFRKGRVSNWQIME